MSRGSSAAMVLEWSPARVLASARLWKSASFLVLSFPLGVLWFCMLTVLIFAGIGTAIAWIGLGILALAMWLWTRAAQVERWRVAVFLGELLPSPYRPLPRGSLLARAKARARDVAVWKELLYFLLLFPVGFFEFGIVVATVGVVAMALVVPVASVALRAYFLTLGAGQVLDPPLATPTIAQTLAIVCAGLVALLVGQYLVLFVARGHAILARTLLGPSKQSRLEARVAALSESRSRVLDTTMVDRQRIERDLHDGAQQRLVALAMNLGMAREKLASDPVAGQALVAEAHEEAKRALAEIRDLVRGIYPAVLADRGLDAAISALAGRCPVPVTVTVELSERLPMAVESTAYFFIAEALTNVAKHSRASEAWVVVRHQGDRLLVEVGDNGVGGADAAGRGLAGLADRVAALDGKFAVSSPPGGPTRIMGELPCGL